MKQIDSSAHIHPNASLGDNVIVGPGAVIGPDVQIGDGCEIRAHAIVTGWTRIGPGCQIGYGAVVGSEPQDLAFSPDTKSYVEIGEKTVLREHATVHRGSKPETVTRVGSNCLLMTEAHVGHNCIIGDNVILANNALCAGYVEVGPRAFISGNAVIHQFCRIGRLALLRGGGRVSKDVPPFCIADTTNRLMGLNIIGLRRAEIDAPTRTALKALFKSLFFGQRPFKELLSHEETRPDLNDLEKEFLAFIRASKRGVVFPQRHHSAADDFE